MLTFNDLSANFIKKMLFLLFKTEMSHICL